MMTQYQRIRIRWFNSLGSELAQVTAFNKRDAADQLRAMISDAGGEIEAGDYFTTHDCGAEG